LQIIPTELYQLLGTIVGGLIGFLTARLMWQTQVRYQRRNLARGLLLEVRQLKRNLGLLAGLFEKVDGLQELRTPIYGSDGLYYSVQKEIASFSPELAEALYSFYMNLLEAERSRQVKRDDQFFGPAATAVRNAVIEAHKMLPALDQLLERESS
jgi:hypothetical protein